MGYLHTGWTLAILVPWCLGPTFAASMSADAGKQASSGALLAPLPCRVDRPPAGLASSRKPDLDINAEGFSGEARKLLRMASLSIGDTEDFKRIPDEIEPRSDLKSHVREFPKIDRSRRGDPFVGLRPAFETRLRMPQALLALAPMRCFTAEARPMSR